MSTNSAQQQPNLTCCLSVRARMEGASASASTSASAPSAEGGHAANTEGEAKRDGNEAFLEAMRADEEQAALENGGSGDDDGGGDEDDDDDGLAGLDEYMQELADVPDTRAGIMDYLGVDKTEGEALVAANMLYLANVRFPE